MPLQEDFVDEHPEGVDVDVLSVRVRKLLRRADADIRDPRGQRLRVVVQVPARHKAAELRDGRIQAEGEQEDVLGADVPVHDLRGVEVGHRLATWCTIWCAAAGSMSFSRKMRWY